MFNIFKVAHYLQSVPQYTQMPENFTIDPTALGHLEDQQLPSIYFAKNLSESPKKQQQSKQTKHGGQAKKGESQQKKNKRNSNDNDNNGGGFLEPIIEDLQGFLRGRRSPPSPVLIQL